MAVESPATGGPMVGFGGKQAWLAVREGSPVPGGSAVPELIRTGLGLHDLGPVPWRTGIDSAYFADDRVMLTPALPGVADSRWVLVVGRWLARPWSAVDVVDLSQSLRTEVQYFATDRTIQRHRWQRAVDGVLVRSFDWLGRDGELLDWRGEPDAAERRMGLPERVEDETGSGAGQDVVGDIVVGEADVLRLAAEWSVDPTALDGRPAPGPLSAAGPV